MLKDYPASGSFKVGKGYIYVFIRGTLASGSGIVEKEGKLFILITI